MSDFEIMKKILTKAVIRGVARNVDIIERRDGKESYIFLPRHKFTFGTDGELIDSVTSSDLFELS